MKNMFRDFKLPDMPADNNFQKQMDMYLKEYKNKVHDVTTRAYLDTLIDGRKRAIHVRMGEGDQENIVFLDVVILENVFEVPN